MNRFVNLAGASRPFKEMIKTKEHYELMDQFEKDFKGEGRMDKEEKELWVRGIVYQSGEVNRLFRAYRLGYALGKSI